MIVCPDFMVRIACSSSAPFFTRTTSPSGLGKGGADFCSSSALATAGGCSAKATSAAKKTTANANAAIELRGCRTIVRARVLVTRFGTRMIISRF